LHSDSILLKYDDPNMSQSTYKLFMMRLCMMNFGPAESEESLWDELRLDLERPTLGELVDYISQEDLQAWQSFLQPTIDPKLIFTDSLSSQENGSTASDISSFADGIPAATPCHLPAQDDESIESEQKQKPEKRKRNVAPKKVSATQTESKRKPRESKQKNETRSEPLTDKQQKRLIANRESAKLSRERRKVHLAELEKAVKTLSAEHEHLESDLIAARIEQRTLLELYAGHLQMFKGIPADFLSVLKMHVENMKPSSSDSTEIKANDNAKQKLLALF